MLRRVEALDNVTTATGLANIEVEDGRYLTDKLEIPVWTSETALTNVVMGCLKVLETPTALKQTLMRSK